MPEPTPPADQQTPPPAEPPATLVLRADLEKLTKREIIDRLVAVEEDVAARDRVGEEVARHFAEPLRPPRASPEDGPVILALLELHKVTTAESRQGSTIRGRKAETTAPRYLEAARTLGDGLVDAILGPNAKV